MARRREWPELTRTLQHVRVPSGIMDGDGTVHWLNDAAIEAVGDIRGRSFVSVVAPEDVPLVRHDLARAGRETQAKDYSIDVFTRDGRRRRVEISSVPLAGGEHCRAMFGIALVPMPRHTGRSHPRLTRRQTEVLELLGEGRSTYQIAARLHLSTQTVRNHVRHVLQALGAHSRLEAVVIAHRDGLLDEG